jgi:molybdopterin converting factor small subunit
MKRKALFHGILSEWVGISQAEIDVPDGGTFSDLLAEIRRTYGQNMPQQLWNKEQRTFNKAVWAMRGQEKLVDPATRLKNGEEVRFLLSLAGGSVVDFFNLPSFSVNLNCHNR